MTLKICPPGVSCCVRVAGVLLLSGRARELHSRLRATGSARAELQTQESGLEISGAQRCAGQEQLVTVSQTKRAAYLDSIRFGGVICAPSLPLSHTNTHTHARAHIIDVPKNVARVYKLLAAIKSNISYNINTLNKDSINKMI